MLAHYIQKIDDYIETHDEISIHDVIEITRRDSHLFPIIILAIFSIVLAPLPGNSMLLGLPLTLLSVLYWFNIDPLRYTWRPFTKKIPCRRWRKYIGGAIPYAEKLQRLFRPRCEWVFRLESRVATGFSLALFSFIMFLPIPFANLPGALGILGIAFGLMERDGLYVLLGYLMMVVYLVAIGFLKHWLFAMM